ncbi:ABC transporter G family member 23-like [Macrosteles quadrilineatus]|uniref:ABC transporter G family member 23-like n=1 Tax=Macrosteles quadrilineatus TaxID=74068 RepID=UPI0023E15023|nr:ABC transporter G family member 23-like [Macrosteles quadrilineatus]
MDVPQDAAITVRGAYKMYSAPNPVLRGLNMTVHQGCIYGLLGPSGCGKTTLLSCIVGRQRLDEGHITVKANSKRNIGYMPQELALYKEFSIIETLVYYGLLFGKTKEEINKRTDELIKLLELPERHNTLDTLSGGQQRRVSFCVALLHNPQLLILDEPTVGVDPVLSHNIWQHLVYMATKEHKTIVITTHYIEEARQAHTIGLMREGVLLAEEPPMALMAAHNTDNLEQAFLYLSQKQSGSQSTEELKPMEYYPATRNTCPSPLNDKDGIRFCRIRAQLYKTGYWMKRNVPIMMFLMMLPVVQCLLFNLCIGQDPKGLYMAVVDEELGGGLADCLSVPMHGCHIESHLSCRYIEKLKSKTINVIEYSSLEEGVRAVKRNDAWGLMHFSGNYTTSLMERVNFTRDASNLSIDLSEVNFWMDMSNQYIGNLLKRDLLFGFISFLKEVFEDCGWPKQVADIPIAFQDAVYGSNTPSFQHFTAPALVNLFEFYLPMMFTVGAILMEKMQGLMERSLVAGMTIREMLITHVIVQFAVLSVQTLLMLVVCFVIFDNPMVGSLALLLLLLFVIGMSGMCYGFMVAVFCDSDMAATFMGLGSFFPLSMLSGMMWPMEGMHQVLKSIGWLLPLTLSTEAFRGISARAWGITHPAVYLGFLSSLGWIVYFMVITCIVVKWRKGLGGK